MVAYNELKRFIPPILAGVKVHTIRGDRRRHARAGEELQLYNGMRTRRCRLIGRPRCIGVQQIGISFSRPQAVWLGLVVGEDGSPAEWERVLYGKPSLDHFARQDGFAGWDAMHAYWSLRNDTESSTFLATLISWDGSYFTGLGAP